jgi:ABC-type transport system involved in multi-copper enzyme maturation permease subunit
MMKIIGPIARATLIEAVRSRMLWLVAVVLGLSFGTAAFLHQVAIIESPQIQGAVVAAMLRACAAFLTASFVVMSMVRESNDKVLELMLAQPWPRGVYLFGKFVGFSTAAIALALLLSLPLLFLVPIERIPLWSLSLACELVVLTAMSLFFVITLTHIVPALAAVFAFYVLARSIAAIQIIASASESSTRWIDRLADLIVSGIALLLPRFDQMTQSAWLVVQSPNSSMIGNILAQTAIYTALLVAAAQFDLHRQNL